MTIVELTLIPIGTKDTSVSKYIAEAEKILKEANVKYELSAMGTTIEADPDKAFEIIRLMQESVFNKGSDRVYSVIKMDDRRDKDHSMEEKVQSVKDKMGE